MKRRKFIKATLLSAAAIPAAAAGSRLYGTPASLLPNGERVADKFLLPLSRTGLPSSTWWEFSSVCQVIENVMTSESESSIFFNNPKRYLSDHGLDASDKTLVDDSVIMLICLTDANVKKSFAKREYDAVLDYFRVAGLFEPRDPSAFGQKVEQLVAANVAEIGKIINASPANLALDQRRVLLDLLEQQNVRVTEDDFAMLSELVSGGGYSTMACTAVAACTVAVVILAIAAAYVSVTVGATVALMAGFTVSIGVMLAVFGLAPYSQPSPVSSANAPFNGALAKLDPVLMRNVERAMRLGAVAKDEGFKLHVLKRMIGEEVDAFLRAMQRNRLLVMSDEELEIASRATTAYSLRVMGV